MSWPKRLISIFYYLLFALVPLTWLSNTSELFEFNKLILTYVLTIFIASTWAIRCIIEKKLIFRRTPLDLPILLFLISNLLSLVFSIDPHTSWFGYYSRWNGGLLSLIAYSLLYWAFVSNLDSKSAQKVVSYSLVSSILISIYGSLEHFGASISCLLTTGSFNVACWVQDVQTRVFATIGQPNWLATYLTALIFIPVSQTLKKFSLYHSLTFILLLTTLLFTKSRSGLLAFGVSSIVFWGVIYFRQKSNLRQFLIPSFGFAICVLTFALIIPNPVRDLIIKSAPNTENRTMNTSTSLEVGGTESGNIRKIVWSGAIKIWQASPKNFLLGTGPETFAMAYYKYRPTEHNQTSEWELLYNKAHNEFLNYLATTGLLGLLSYLLLLGVQCSIFVKKSPNTEYRILNTALLAGWLTISVTNFWGFSVVIVQLFLFLFPAIATVIEDGERSRIHDQ